MRWRDIILRRLVAFALRHGSTPVVYSRRCRNGHEWCEEC